MERKNEDRSETGSHSCCDGTLRDSVGVRQTLPEMEFERGIWYAAQNNDAERVENLLKKGCSPNIQDGAGYTALHYASRNGHLGVCKILMKNGADVNAVTRCGNATSLHRSSMRDMGHVVDYLLKSGCDPNIRDSDGYTALHRAVLANSATICGLLIPVTRLSICDNKSRDPLQLARDIGNPDVIDMFSKIGTTLSKHTADDRDGLSQSTECQLR